MQQIEDDDMARQDRSEQPAPERDPPRQAPRDRRSGNESPQSAPSLPLQNDGLELVRDSHC
jgi:hypothetical protein